LVARDADADGAFFYAVKTTGVFCRPTCASRMPRRQNVSFFDDPAAARAAGFRACKRCQPEREPREVEIVRRACAVLDASDRGICKIAFGDAVASLVADLGDTFANAECVAAPERLAPFLAEIDASLRGSSERIALPLDISATAFQQRVWEALQKIPYG
ncbi:Ada metal-binding domain-containing protein, partial [Burkholderia anthina]|uniref:Ada metal-binding domain-containing protein n=1 Tax=Burkholderia anthina TaxID=179879 RepID=UPI00244565C0